MNKKSFNQKQVAVLILLTWFALCWSWTLSTDSLELSGSRAEGLVIAGIVSVINASISVWIIRKAIEIARTFFKSYRGWQALILTTGLFAAADFLVAWLTTIIWLGPQGSIDNVLPLSSPTLLLIHTPLGFASRIVGFYGLAAFAWLIAFLVAHKRYRKLLIYPATTLCLLAFAGWIFYRYSSGGQTQVKIVNEALDHRIPPVVPGDANLILFPEYGLDDITPENIDKRIAVQKDNPVKYIGSKQQITKDKTGNINALIFGDTHQGVATRLDKHRLIPGGEDLPYAARIGLILARQSSTIDYFSFAKEIRKSPQPLHPVRINSETFAGAAVCSSIISPEDYRKLTRDGATLLTNSASLGVFKGSPVFNLQQQSLAKFMATANARYFLQAANDASSYAMSTNGKTIASTQEHGVLDVTAQNSSTRTLYTLLGEWLAIAGGLAVMGLLIVPRIFNFTTKKG